MCTCPTSFSKYASDVTCVDMVQLGIPQCCSFITVARNDSSKGGGYRNTPALDLFTNNVCAMTLEMTLALDKFFLSDGNYPAVSWDHCLDP